jgi:hypothetical protein
MSIDLKKMTEELVERYLSGRDVPFKNPDIYRALQSAHGSWLPRFAYDLARQVAEAVLNESIKICEDWYVGNISDNVPTAEYLCDLKREICGKEKKP